jgi:hypothetical protein
MSCCPPNSWSFTQWSHLRCGMLHPIPIFNHFKLICQRRQTLIDCNAHCKNQDRIYQDYEVGDDVLVKVYNPTGLEQCSVSLFTVEKVHMNGTLAIKHTHPHSSSLSLRSSIEGSMTYLSLDVNHLTDDRISTLRGFGVALVLKWVSLGSPGTKWVIHLPTHNVHSNF